MIDAIRPAARVLVVEDEELVREILIWAFEDLGFEVIGASSGDEAAGMFQSAAQFDVLFTDIRMPGTIDGWTLAEKAREVSPALPVIYASGFSSEPPRQVPQSIFLQKPLRTDALRQALITLGMPVP
jgi:CheY-like chemotaxis protein